MSEESKIEEPPTLEKQAFDAFCQNCDRLAIDGDLFASHILAGLPLGFGYDVGYIRRNKIEPCFVAYLISNSSVTREALSRADIQLFDAMVNRVRDALYAKLKVEPMAVNIFQSVSGADLEDL